VAGRACGLCGQLSASFVFRQLQGLVTGLALASDRQHEDRIDLRNIAVKGNITARLSTDDQFAHVIPSWAPQQGIRFKHIDRLDDLIDPRSCLRDFVLCEVFENSIEIIGNLRRKLNARHRDE